MITKRNGTLNRKKPLPFAFVVAIRVCSLNMAMMLRMLTNRRGGAERESIIKQIVL